MADICEILRESLRERESQIKRLEKEIEALRIVISITEERAARPEAVPEAKAPDVNRPFPPQRAAVAEPAKTVQRLP